MQLLALLLLTVTFVSYGYETGEVVFLKPHEVKERLDSVNARARAAAKRQRYGNLHEVLWDDETAKRAQILANNCTWGALEKKNEGLMVPQERENDEFETVDRWQRDVYKIGCAENNENCTVYTTVCLTIAVSPPRFQPIENVEPGSKCGKLFNNDGLCSIRQGSSSSAVDFFRISLISVLINLL